MVTTSASSTPLPRSGGRAVQLGMDVESTPLAETTFCVVDLETTGGSPTEGRITEIGAVRVRGGRVLGEFQTFVDPDQPIPAFISVLTGITDNMVAGAPREYAAVPMLLDFLADSVLVAHNAPYDTGFLKATCERLGLCWPQPQVVDTARLSRSTLARDEVPNHKLATLAAFFRASTSPTHRALDDARATVDVLHGLLERLGSLGVLTLDELTSAMRHVPEARRRKRHLAERLPETRGVYVFRDAEGKPLYVGVSTNIRKRVMSYFTTSEQRSRMTEMVGIAESVTAVVCQTDLEARVRELRMIADWKPPYNRRSRHPERRWWVKLTAEAFPRLSLVRSVADDAESGARYFGPYGARRSAEAAGEALVEVFGLRTCRTRIRPGVPTADCALAQMDRCPAPCRGDVSVADYGRAADAVRATVACAATELVTALRSRMAELANQERYEDAAVWRNRMTAALRGIDTAQQLDSLGRIGQVVAAAPTSGGWDLHVIRHGRLAGSTHIPHGADARAAWVAAEATAASVDPPPPPTSAADPAETLLILRWLAEARLVESSGSWWLPADGAGRWLSDEVPG